MLSLGMNKSWWESLSYSDQLIIKAASHMENNIMMAEYNANNSSSLEKLINEHGVILRRFDNEIFKKFGEASLQVFDETRQHSNLVNRIHESFVNSRKNFGRWTNISDQEFIRQRNKFLGVI